MSGKSKYSYKLQEWEQKELNKIISAKICNKEKRLRAYILLKCDNGQEGGYWTEDKIMEAYGVSSTKIYNTRKRMTEEGLYIALGRKKRLIPPTPRKLDGEQEAHLSVIACSKSPKGRSNWTLELIVCQAWHNSKGA
jgi:transposase